MSELNNFRLSSDFMQKFRPENFNKADNDSVSGNFKKGEKQVENKEDAVDTFDSAKSGTDNKITREEYEAEIGKKLYKNLQKETQSTSNTEEETETEYELTVEIATAEIHKLKMRIKMYRSMIDKMKIPFIKHALEAILAQLVASLESLQNFIVQNDRFFSLSPNGFSVPEWAGGPYILTGSMFESCYDTTPPTGVDPDMYIYPQYDDNEILGYNEFSDFLERYYSENLIKHTSNLFQRLGLSQSEADATANTVYQTSMLNMKAYFQSAYDFCSWSEVKSKFLEIYTQTLNSSVNSLDNNNENMIFRSETNPLMQHTRIFDVTENIS